MNLNRALEGLLDEMANYSAASLFYQLSGSPDQEITFKRCRETFIRQFIGIAGKIRP